MRTHSVLPAEIIYRADIRALHLFESSLILNQQSGTGSGVPETHNSCILEHTKSRVAFWKVLNKKQKLKYNSLIWCDTVLDVSLLQSLKSLDDSKQLRHVIIPSETGLIIVVNVGHIMNAWINLHLCQTGNLKYDTYFSRSLAFLYNFTS